MEDELQRFGVAVEAVEDLFSATQGSIGEPLGESAGPYRFVQSAEPYARHRRAVSWIASGVVRDAFEADLMVTLNGQHTVQEFKAARAARRLKSLAETGVDPGPVGPPLIEKP